MVSLTTLSWVALYRNWFVAVTLAALALAVWSVIARRGRVSRAEWAVLGGSATAVVGLLAYTVSIEGLPSCGEPRLQRSRRGRHAWRNAGEPRVLRPRDVR
jgi:hypothetical protein